MLQERQVRARKVRVGDVLYIYDDSCLPQPSLIVAIRKRASSAVPCEQYMVIDYLTADGPKQEDVDCDFSLTRIDQIEPALLTLPVLADKFNYDLVAPAQVKIKSSDLPQCSLTPAGRKRSHIFDYRPNLENGATTCRFCDLRLDQLQMWSALKRDQLDTTNEGS